MVKRMSFTASRLSALSCENNKDQDFYFDTQVRHLAVRVTAKGAKSYIFESRLNGKTVRMTIGDIAVWSIGNARKEAVRLKEMVDRGIDPRQEKVDQRNKAEARNLEEKRRSITVQDAWTAYLEARRNSWSARHYIDHLKLSSPGGERKARGNGITVAGALASLMPKRLSDLTCGEVANWLRSESETRPTNAALAFRLLRAFVRWADEMPIYRGLVPSDACSARMVRDELPKNKAKDGDCLQREHLSGWFEQVRKLPSPIISAYLQALLLTGARREEMANLRWDDVDLQWRSLTIRDKVDGIRTIPLTPYLATLIAALPRRNGWVFSSPTSSTGRLMEPTIAHRKALEAAGLPHITLHGLRRSFGTLCEWVEMPTGISAQIMGHKPSALAEKHYRRRSLDLLRKWHDHIEEWMLTQAGVTYVPTNFGLRIASSA